MTSYKDHYYYVRIATGLIVTGYVFIISGVTASLRYKNYEGFVRTEGQTSYYSSMDVLSGSNGQVMFSAVVATLALLAAVVAITRFAEPPLQKAKTLLQIAGFLLIPVAFVGWMGVAAINFLLLGDLIGNRKFFWFFLMIFLVVGVVGTLFYAKDSKGTLLDYLDKI